MGANVVTGIILVSVQAGRFFRGDLHFPTGILNLRCAAPAITVKAVAFGTETPEGSMHGFAVVFTSQGASRRALRYIIFTVNAAVHVCALAAVASYLVFTGATMFTRIGFTLISIVVYGPEIFCFLVVLKDFPGLLLVASLLVTLSFQVALQDLLNEEGVGTFRPLEEGAG